MNIKLDKNERLIRVEDHGDVTTFVIENIDQEKRNRFVKYNLHHSTNEFLYSVDSEVDEEDQYSNCR